MAQALDRPRCTATITDDDTVQVSIDGVVTSLGSMDGAIAHLAETARTLGRPVKVVAIDPSSENDSETYLVVGPDGDISTDETATRPCRTGRRSGPAVSLQELVPAASGPEPVLTEPERSPFEEVDPLPSTIVDETSENASQPRSLQATPMPSSTPAPPPSDTTVLGIDSAPSFIATDSSLAEAPAIHGWRGMLNRMGLHLTPGPAEVAEREDLAAVSRHWVGSRTIAVVNQKGGANKTPTVALLAAQFARHGGAGVLAWDNNEAMGSLGWRTEGAGHDATALDVPGHEVGGVSGLVKGENLRA
ncbi:hypothetical protein AUQ48_16720 [Kocuria flava]|uniref:CobQ/CobB/MinD/ParA nucleotide binding domain-containing protein n=1 Tax=Kocuria flava TaxID=446860 RepID=A0A2N4SXJ5_9MICC|nr:hypothetical protein [Kocuria flava]PLC10701.1 hypothetical protein AUQ48_16720 [Kocuria flava]